jgi:hypothetical protein
MVESPTGIAAFQHQLADLHRTLGLVRRPAVIADSATASVLPLQLGRHRTR